MSIILIRYIIMNNESALTYLLQISQTRSPRTYSTYRWALQVFFDLVGDNAPLTTDTYALFLRRASEMNNATQALVRTAVRGLYKFYGIDHAVNQQEIENITKQLGKRYKIGLPRFDGDAIEQFIKYADTLKGGLRELRDRAFVILLADTGLRISEALSLKRGSIDWKEYRALVTGKGGDETLVRVSVRAVEALRDYLALRQPLDAKTGKPLNSLPLFAQHYHETGKKIVAVKVTGMWNSIKDRMKEAGIDPTTIRIHDFRHYLITRIYQGTGNIKITQNVARHKSMNTTSRYTHMDPETDAAYDEVINRGNE